MRPTSSTEAGVVPYQPPARSLATARSFCDAGRPSSPSSATASVDRGDLADDARAKDGRLEATRDRHSLALLLAVALAVCAGALAGGHEDRFPFGRVFLFCQRGLYFIQAPLTADWLGLALQKAR